MYEWMDILRLITQITAGYDRLIGFVVILMLSWNCLFQQDKENFVMMMMMTAIKTTKRNNFGLSFSNDLFSYSYSIKKNER